MATNEEVNALQQVQDLIASSIRTGDARAVGYWHVFLQYIETNSLITVLESFNLPVLRNVINGLKGKREFLEMRMNRHDVNYKH